MRGLPRFLTLLAALAVFAATAGCARLVPQEAGELPEGANVTDPALGEEGPGQKPTKIEGGTGDTGRGNVNLPVERPSATGAPTANPPRAGEDLVYPEAGGRT